jgi:hypothetical protein
MRVATGNQEHGTDHPVDEKAHGRGLSQTSKSARLDFHGLRRNSHEVKMKIACARLMKAGIASNIRTSSPALFEAPSVSISH